MNYLFHWAEQTVPTSGTTHIMHVKEAVAYVQD